MAYAKFNLSTPESHLLGDVIKDCPYGILHIKCPETGNKLAVLVEVFYSPLNGLSCRIAHSNKDLLEELCTEPVSLKLCNKEKNIYVVADVQVSPEGKQGFFIRNRLKMAITRFNFFKKNKPYEMISLTGNPEFLKH
jgi:hypothetical protein